MRVEQEEEKQQVQNGKDDQNSKVTAKEKDITMAKDTPKRKAHQKPKSNIFIDLDFLSNNHINLKKIQFKDCTIQFSSLLSMQNKQVPLAHNEDLSF